MEEDLSKLSNEELERRILHEEAKKDSFKILCNALYGINGSRFTRLQTVDVAEATTKYEREIIEGLSKLFLDMGYSIYLSDTDSLFVHATYSEMQTIQDIANNFVKQKYGVDNIKFDFKGYWSRIGFPRGAATTDVKKRYYGIIAIDDKGRKDKFEQVGVEAVRGDWCFTEGTEVLTSIGWKDFKDVSFDDKIATLDKESKTIIEYQHPLKIIKQHYEGDTVSVKTQSIEFQVTPEHRILTINRKNNEINFIEARHLTASAYRIPRVGIWNGLEPDTFILPNGNSILFQNWIKFMAAYLAEGWTEEKIVSIGQKNEIVLIKEILKSLPFNVIEIPRSDGLITFRINSKQLATLLGYTTSKYKRIPQYIKNATSTSIRLFLDIYNKLDGYTYKGIKYYVTSSKEMANDIQELIFKTGGVSIIHKHSYKGFSFHTMYLISEKKRTVGYIKEKDIKHSFYKGMIYCVSVPNEIIYIRRNGKPMWSGNCKLAVEVQTEVMKKLLTDTPKEDIKKYLADVRQKLFNGIYDDKLIITKGIRHDLNSYKVLLKHVKALMSALDSGWVPPETMQYSQVRYVMVKWNTPKLAHLVKQNEPDYFWYWSKQIVPLMYRLMVVDKLESYKPKKLAMMEGQSTLI